MHQEEWNKAIEENQKLLIEFDEHSKNLNLRNTTQINNFKTLLRLAKGLDISFKEITKNDVKQYFRSINVNGITKQTYYHTFMKFFRWLGKIEVLDDIKDMRREKKSKKAEKDA